MIWTLWPIPKNPSCLLDKAIINMAKNPELALKLNIIENNNKFWRKVYEKKVTNFNTSNK